MRKKVLIILILAMAFISITLFPKLGKESITFFEVRQNKAKTLSKYKEVWDNKVIKEVVGEQKKYEYGDIVGSITIPKINLYEVPIYYGENDITNNWNLITPGYEAGWGMAGEEGIMSIGAHNYQLLFQLPNLEIGDEFIFENSIDTYVYEITGTTVYYEEKEDWYDTVYKDQEEYSINLMTCYPIEKAKTEDRYIVFSKMIKGSKLIYK